MAEQQQDRAEILEEGQIYFVFRPKVEEEDPSGADDVERFYMVLRPQGQSPLRLVVIGRKHLPDVGDHERGWGFVEAIARDGKALEEGLRENTYETKTRGQRTQPAARAAGEGVYALLRDGSSTYLAYSLSRPEQPGPVQKAFNIRDQGGFILSIKNPEKGSPPGVGLPEERQAEYPKALRKVFRDRRFADEDPRLLDYEGAELVLVGADAQPEEAHGIDVEREVGGKADIFRQLRFAKSRHPTEPLLEGQWG